MNLFQYYVSLFVVLLTINEVTKATASGVDDALSIGLLAFGTFLCKLFGKSTNALTTSKAGKHPLNSKCTKKKKQCDTGLSCFIAKRTCRPTPKGTHDQKENEFCLKVADCQYSIKCEAASQECRIPINGRCKKDRECVPGLRCDKNRKICLGNVGFKYTGNSQCAFDLDATTNCESKTKKCKKCVATDLTCSGDPPCCDGTKTCKKVSNTRRCG